MSPGYHRFPSILSRVTIVAVISLSLTPPLNAQTTEPEPTITFEAGGFGHGVGMSQYGAYGRALAGHTFDEILGFYYDGSTLSGVETFSDGTTDFATDDDVDVRVEIRSETAVSPPNDQAGSWEIDIYAGSTLLGSSQNSVNARWSGGRWVTTTEVGGADVDLCAGRAECAGSTLEFAMSGEERVVLEETRHGANFAYVMGGRIILHPASVPGPKGTTTTLCGSGDQFCVIHGDLDLQTYLYGLREVPSSWPVETLKAQVVAGRSYAVSRILSRNASSSWQAPFDLYRTVDDQYYEVGLPNRDGPCAGRQSWCNAVDHTNDLVATYNGGIVETFYSASNGGATAEPPDVWAGGTTRPYLKAKADPYDSFDANPYRIRDVTYTIEQVSRWLNEYTPPAGVDPNQLKVGTLQRVIIDAGPSGRVTFADVTLVGTERTTQVVDRVSSGRVISGPYGFRFYYALQKGCEAEKQAGADVDCLRSTNFKVKGFADVPSGVFYYDAVNWMRDNQLTNGVDGGRNFAPTRDINRAEAATLIWRFMGSPQPEAQSTNPFSDVVADAYYADAIQWMVDNGITTGKSPTSFAPLDNITRAEMSTFLWRVAGQPETAPNEAFTDVADHRYFFGAVSWMAGYAITNGTTATTFAPERNLTRGEMATFIWRLAGLPSAFADGTTPPDLMRVSHDS